jgi:hypothetical protein
MTQTSELSFTYETIIDTYTRSKNFSLFQVITIISFLAISTFLSIMMFYNTQMPFAIINSSFLTILTGSVIYFLSFPPSSQLDREETAQPTKRPSRAFSCPHRRVSQIREDPDGSGRTFEKPRVHFQSPLDPTAILERRKTIQHLSKKT